MTTSVLSALHKLSLKNQLKKTDIQYAAMNLCKDFGVLQQQFLTVVDFIQQTIGENNGKKNRAQSFID
jgi:hypothetical protein